MSILRNIQFSGYTPGTIGRIVQLQSIYYSQEIGTNRYFEAEIAKEIADFFFHYDETRDGFWTVTFNNRIEGSIFVDATEAETEGARLKWLYLSPALRGHGIGRMLVNKTIDFCREKKYPSIYLWTSSFQKAAHKLYKKIGFELAERCEDARDTRVSGDRFAFEKYVLIL